MGVILRTIDDFLGEIEFLEEGLISGELNSEQKRFVELFFSEDSVSLSDLLEERKGPNWVKRREIWASQGRLLNYDRAQRMSRAVNIVLSGYVHGWYSRIMEMYRGGTGGNEGFMVHGMLGNPNNRAFRWQIACYAHRALNDFALVANGLGLVDLHNDLVQTRGHFESSSAYTD